MLNVMGRYETNLHLSKRLPCCSCKPQAVNRRLLTAVTPGMCRTIPCKTCDAQYGATQASDQGNWFSPVCVIPVPLHIFMQKDKRARPGDFYIKQVASGNRLY